MKVLDESWDAAGGGCPASPRDAVVQCHGLGGMGLEGTLCAPPQPGAEGTGQGGSDLAFPRLRHKAELKDFVLRFLLEEAFAALPPPCQVWGPSPAPQGTILPWLRSPAPLEPWSVIL